MNYESPDTADNLLQFFRLFSNFDDTLGISVIYGMNCILVTYCQDFALWCQQSDAFLLHYGIVNNIKFDLIMVIFILFCIFCFVFINLNLLVFLLQWLRSIWTTSALNKQRHAFIAL